MAGRMRAWRDDILTHRVQMVLALIFFGLAILATVVSSNYVDETRSVAVPDLILDSLPTLDLSIIYIWGGLLVFVVYLSYPLLYEPRRFHYALGLLSIFLLIRSGFIVLTHLKAPAGAVIVAAPWFLQVLTYSNDLFFSGHTGLPFLGFLVFEHRLIKYFMLASSIILALTVLFMHVHYSIDVASAYFITYGAFVIGTPLFESAIGERGSHGKKS